MVELLLLDEVEELIELVLGLAGEAHDEGGPEDGVRDRAADDLDALAGLGEPRALHALEHRVRAMLERHVEVGDDVREAGHRFCQPRRDAPGVGVHQADPRDLRDSL